jgi:hypothetical protein
MNFSFSLNVGQQKEDSLSRIDDINTKPGDGPHHDAKAKPHEFIFQDPLWVQQTGITIRVEGRVKSLHLQVNPNRPSSVARPKKKLQRCPGRAHHPGLSHPYQTPGQSLSIQATTCLGEKAAEGSVATAAVQLRCIRSNHPFAKRFVHLGLLWLR